MTLLDQEKIRARLILTANELWVNIFTYAVYSSLAKSDTDSILRDIDKKLSNIASHLTNMECDILSIQGSICLNSKL